jgi:hypothetical protein
MLYGMRRREERRGELKERKGRVAYLLSPG